jgi:site-specific recombinase XerC
MADSARQRAPKGHKKNDLAVVEKPAQWERLKAMVLDSVSSPITKRVYNMALTEFMAWFQQAPRPGFTKATVSAWRVSLEERKLGSSSIIIRMSAIRKLAAEAADNGLLAPELAQGISRVKSVKSTGIRVGNWLSQRQAQTLLSAPDISTVRGLRDRAILAVLLGCGLRRSEVAALTFTHVQQRDGRWCIVDLVGKHGRVRTAPMPAWVKVAIDAWTSPAGVVDGHAFRPVSRAGAVAGERLGERLCGKCSGSTLPKSAFQALRLTTFGALVRSCAAPPAANWSRSRCSSATHRSRRPSDTSEPSRIWSTPRTMRFACGFLLHGG